MASLTLTEAPHQHQQIAWAGQSGYPGAKYCCVCSYSVRVKPSTACSQPDCPNLACADCFNDGPFCCSTTEGLRRAAGIPHPVTYAAAEDTPPSTPAAPQPDPLAPQPPIETEDSAVREDLLSNPPEGLVDIILRLRNEVHGLKCIVETYRARSERTRKQREALVETISSMDSLAQVEQDTPIPPPTTQATSALPSKIDQDWQEVCSSHPRWRGWWESGKPRALRKVTHDPPEDTETAPPPRRRPGQPTQATQTPPPSVRNRNPPSPSRSTPPTPSRPPRHHHHYNRGRGDTPRHTHHRPQPLWTQASPPFCGRCRQRGHTVNHCSETICDFCGRRGHLADQCRKRQAEAKRSLECAYCQRRGHTDDECYARAADIRQERLLRAILSEHQPPITQPAPYQQAVHAPPYPSWPHPPHTPLPLIR